MKDKEKRRSRGVAFVLFLDRESTYKAVRALNNTQMFGRTIKCSVAKDNGRAADYIRRKVYPDKSRCYECGEEGHLSYKCPNNILGEREPPPKKDKKKKKNEDGSEYVDLSGDDDSGKEGEEEGEDPKKDSLAAAIDFQQQMMADQEASSYATAMLNMSAADFSEPRRKKYKKDAYFSDEEEIDDT